MAHEETTKAAQLALGSAWRGAVAVELTEVMVDYPDAPAVLLRANVDSSQSGRPPTVVIKKANTLEGVQAEWAAMNLLAALPATRDFVPRPLAMDAKTNLIVMADLSGPDVQRVGDLLFDGTRDRAERALDSTQSVLGQLHAAGLSPQRRLEFRAKLEGGRSARHAVNKLEHMLVDLPQLLQKHLARPVPTDIDAEVQRARVELFTPGPFITISHGDPTVGNVLYSDALGVRLLDLETVGFRHALLDGSFARLRYLHSVWARRIPDTLRHRLLDSYRTELVVGCSAAADDRVFAHALVAGCAAWLAALCSHLDRVARVDIRWGRSTYRERIAAALSHFVDVAAEYHQMPALADTAHQLEQQLRRTWDVGESSLSPYPALDEGHQPPREHT